MERKAMMGHLVSKSSEGCGTIGDNMVLSKTRLPKDRVLGHAKARALMWNPISVLKTSRFDGHRWSCHVVLFLCVCRVKERTEHRN